MDRFMMKFHLGYPDHETEKRILLAQVNDHTVDRIEPGATIECLTQILDRAKSVYVDVTIADFIVSIMRSSREHPAVFLGASPRASVAMMQAARARAYFASPGFRHSGRHQRVGAICSRPSSNFTSRGEVRRVRPRFDNRINIAKRTCARNLEGARRPNADGLRTWRDHRGGDIGCRACASANTRLLARALRYDSREACTSRGRGVCGRDDSRSRLEATGGGLL